MVNSKLPRRLAIAGLIVGVGFMAMWWYIYDYNPFDLPTAQQVQAMASGYSAPPLYNFLENATLYVFPLLWLQAFTTDLGVGINLAI